MLFKEISFKLYIFSHGFYIRELPISYKRIPKKSEITHVLNIVLSHL